MPRLSVSGCGANSYSSHIIDPSGDLYKCWNHMGQKDRIVGNIYGEVFINDTYTKFVLQDNINDKCKSCQILPLCYGGCSDYRINDKDLENRCQVHKFNIKEQLELYVYNKLNLNM